MGGVGRDVEDHASLESPAAPTQQSLAQWEKDARRGRRRQRRCEAVTGKARRPLADAGRCRVFGCGRPARGATHNGLDRRYCRPHADHKARHGDSLRGSYPPRLLALCRAVARRWIKDHAAATLVSVSLTRIQRLMDTAGPHVPAFRLAGLTPQERCKAHWARLRHAGVDSATIVSAWLAVEMVLANDPWAHGQDEYRRVQNAKAVHRLASGTHRRWQHPISAGLHERPVVRVEEQHSYPHSRGRILRHIGKEMETAMEWLRPVPDELRKKGAAIVGAWGTLHVGRDTN